MKNARLASPRNILIYSILTFLDRFVYYGFRGMVILYFISEAAGMERDTAFTYYGTFTGFLYLMLFLGALIGDLLRRNDLFILIGSVIALLGLSCFFIGSETLLLLGFFVSALGFGLLKSNLRGQFARQYKFKAKFLDSLMSFHYWIINLGAFLGILLIGLLYEINFNYALILCIALILIIVMLTFLLEKRSIQPSTEEEAEFSIMQKESSGSSVLKWINIAVGIVLIAIFWTFSDYVGPLIMDYSANLKSFDLFGKWPIQLSSINGISIFIFAILFALLWAFVHYSRSTKIAMGFAFIALAYFIAFMLDPIQNGYSATTIIVILCLFSLAEIHINPVIDAYITNHVPERFVSTFLGISGILIKLAMSAMAILPLVELESKFLIIGILMSIIALGLLIYRFFIRKMFFANA